MSRLLILLLVFFISCNNDVSRSKATKADTSKSQVKGTFGYDLEFLRKYHKDLVLLGDDTLGARVLIAPAYQGRVMTSTADGDKGLSFGWVNYELIASNKPAEHINAFGGEERLWLGPEGGQFSIFFKKGSEFSFDNWYVPKEFDSEPFMLVSSTGKEAKFQKQMHLENYSDTKFDLLADRIVRFLDRAAIDSILGISIPSTVKSVAFESDNSITNKGLNAWSKKTGLLSIWILSMMNASEKTTVTVPFKQGDSAKFGKIVTDDYFGKVPGDRLKIESGLMLLKADAKYRSKIGVSPQRALPLIGSFDAINNVLTIAQFSLPNGATDYVNSLWQIQDKPFAGDAVNSYNDGPIQGKQMGNFYEVESSSPAAVLAPGQTIHHVHRTVHLNGSKEDLDKIAIKLFGVGVDKIKL